MDLNSPIWRAIRVTATCISCKMINLFFIIWHIYIPLRNHGLIPRGCDRALSEAYDDPDTSTLDVPAVKQLLPFSSNKNVSKIPSLQTRLLTLAFA